jgi:hypothetical protein
MSQQYTTLNITSSATKAEILSAYRKESLRCHPDKGGDPATIHTITDAKDYCLNQLELPIELRGRLESKLQSPPTTPPPSSCAYPAWAYQPFANFTSPSSGFEDLMEEPCSLFNIAEHEFDARYELSNGTGKGLKWMKRSEGLDSHT